jgi:hypothetical protein
MAAHMARSTSGERGTGRAERRRARRLLSAVAALLAAVLGACNCIPEHASELAHADFETPRHTLASFRAYAGAGLYDLEYRCFSNAFKTRNHISILNYSEARTQLKRDKPWLFWFDSRVVAEQVLDERQHVLDVQVAGRTVRVKLVREETFRIWAGEELLADGALDLRGALALVGDSGGRSSLQSTLPIGNRTLDPSQVTRVTLDTSWKIDDLWEGSEP